MRQLLKPRSALALAAALLLLGAGWVGYEQLRRGDHHVIHGSYAFDVTDQRQLAGHSDDIFVGRVTEVARVEQDGPPRTVFRVLVERTLKGDVTGTVLVKQLGGDIGKDSWRTEDQELLQPDQRYLLATTHSKQDSGVHVVLAGPVSIDEISGTEDLQQAVDQWRQAIANQRTPDALGGGR